MEGRKTKPKTKVIVWLLYNTQIKSALYDKRNTTRELKKSSSHTCFPYYFEGYFLLDAKHSTATWLCEMDKECLDLVLNFTLLPFLGSF